MPFNKKNVCLTCLKSGHAENPLISVFNNQASFNMNLLEMLQTLTDIRLFEEFPSTICNQCCSILLASYNFKQRSTENYNFLCRSLLNSRDGNVDVQNALSNKDPEIVVQNLNNGLVDNSSKIGKISLVPASMLIERHMVEPTLPSISLIPAISSMPSNFPIISSIMTTTHEPPSILENLLTSVEDQQEIDQQEMAQQEELRSMLNTPPALFSCFDCDDSFSSEQLLIDHRVFHKNPAIKTELNIELTAIDIPYEIKQEPVDLDDESDDMEVNCSTYNEEENNNAARDIQIVSAKSVMEEGELTQQMLLNMTVQSTFSSNLHKCVICLKSFLSSLELQQHNMSHIRQGKCIYCPKIFGQYCHLSNHTRDKHPNQFLKFQEKTLLQGQKCSVWIRPLVVPKCVSCELTFWNENSLEKHVDEEHLIVDQEIKGVSRVEDIQKFIVYTNGKIDKFCRKCNTRFFRIDSFMKHMDAHLYQMQQNNLSSQNEVTENYDCTKCTSKFLSPEVLKFHMSRVHSRNSIYIDAQPVKNIGKDYEFVEGNNSLVRCKICQKEISFKSFSSHMKLHAEFKQFGCEFCDQRFARSDYLNNHMRQVHPTELRCEHCNLQVRSRSLLDTHITNTHAAIMHPVEVNIIEESSDHANVVIKPEPVSRDPSPTPQALLLDEAPENFMVASLSQACHEDNSDYDDVGENLSNKKKRAQSKSAGYVTCPICKKTLLQQSLRNHIQFHDELKKCQICGQEYARNDYLISHMKNVHTAEELKPFNCSVCSRLCPGSKNLDWHMRRFHKSIIKLKDFEVLPELARDVNLIPLEEPASPMTSIPSSATPWKCKPCNKIFKGLNFYNSHMQYKHSVKGELKKTANIIQVVQAEQATNPPKPVSSSHENSSREILSKKEIEKQYQITRNRLNVKCKICKKVIKLKYISRHMELHMAHKKYQCECCDEKFARSDYLSKHIRVYHLAELYCTICKTQMFKKSLYTQHLLDVHQISEELSNSTMNQSDTEENANESSYQDQDNDSDYDAGTIESDNDEITTTAKKFRCTPCNRVFSGESYYNMHMRFKHSHPTVFKYPSDDPDVIQIEEPNTSSNVNLFCEPCNKPFSSDYYLNMHNKFKHSLSTNFKEEPADKSSLVVYNAPEIPEVVKETNSYTCEFCSKSFKIIYKYNAHMKIKHGINPPASQLVPIIISEDSMQSEGTTINTTVDLQEKEIAEARLYECDICDMTVNRRDYLDRHVKAQHPHEFECRPCNQQFSTFHYFLRHMDLSHDNLMLGFSGDECKTCNKQFSDSKNLELHITNKHSGNTLHKPNCSMCGIQFGNAFQEQKHPGWGVHKYMKQLMAKRKNIQTEQTSDFVPDAHNEEVNFKYLPIQTSEKNVQCAICTKTFATIGKANAHTKNHKEIFLYKCTQCNFTFLEKRVIDRHFKQFHKEAASYPELVLQLNELNNTLPAISQSTSSDIMPSSLKRARLSLPNKKVQSPIEDNSPSSFILRGPRGKHECKVCGLLFNKRIIIMRHLKTHSEIAHVNCPICGFISFNSRSLNYHMKKSHGVGPDGETELVEDEVLPAPTPVPLRAPDLLPAPESLESAIRQFPKKPRTRLSVYVENPMHKAPAVPPLKVSTAKKNATHEFQATEAPENVQELAKVIENSEMNIEIVPNGIEDLSCSALATVDLISDSEDVQDSPSTSRKTVECKICLKFFTRIDNLQNHIKYRHKTDNVENKCGVCGNLLVTSELLLEHLKKHRQSNNKFFCSICDISFDLKPLLLRHNTQWHNKNNPEMDRPFTKQTGYNLVNAASIDKTQNILIPTPKVLVAKSKKIKNVIPINDGKGSSQFKIKFYKCDLCIKTFTRHDRCILHRKVDHKGIRNKKSSIEDESDELEETDEDSNIEDVAELTVEKRATVASGEINTIIMRLPSSLAVKKISTTSPEVFLPSIVSQDEYSRDYKLYDCDKCKLSFEKEQFLMNHKKNICSFFKQISPNSSIEPSTSHV